MSEILEWLAVIAALIYVYLASKGNRICFLFGLISSVIFIQICFFEKLYFDTAINAYYVVMSFVGWFSWKSDTGKIKAIKIPTKSFILYSVMAMVVSFILGYVTQTYTEANLPFIDSFTTVMAVMGTWMMVRKMIENWIIWIIADGVSIGMYIYKDHYPIALLFFIYTVISVFGYIHWKKTFL